MSILLVCFLLLLYSHGVPLESLSPSLSLPLFISPFMPLSLLFPLRLIQVDQCKYAERVSLLPYRNVCLVWSHRHWRSNQLQNCRNGQ